MHQSLGTGVTGGHTQWAGNEVVNVVSFRCLHSRMLYCSAKYPTQITWSLLAHFPSSTDMHMVSTRLAVKSTYVDIAYRGRSRKQRQFLLLSCPQSHLFWAHEACSMHDSGELVALRTNFCRVTTNEPGTSTETLCVNRRVQDLV